jgi:hypothetical protein
VNSKSQWNAYLEAEQKGLRRQTMLTLQNFIDAILLEDPSLRNQWAIDLAREIELRAAICCEC